MASRIAALQAKLGGGGMIMGGMRPGGRPPMRKKKQRPRRASLDNSALLTRTTVKGNRKKKRPTAINFDVLEDEKVDDAFAESMASDINMKKTKPVTDSNNNNNSNTTKPKPFRMGGMMGGGMMGGGMGGLLANSGALRKKKAKKAATDDHLGPRRDRAASRSFSKGVTTTPLIDLNQEAGYKGSKTPTPNSKNEAFPAVAEEPSGLRCEIVKQEAGLKAVRLFASYDKYFEAKKGDNGKGLVVINCVDSNFRALGISIGWKLSKLGKRNVTKKSFIMLRNQLMAQASTAKQHGYELTFSDPANNQRHHSSQPNSPNIATRRKKGTHNAPGTVPFKPAQPQFQLEKKSLDEKRRDIQPKQATTGLATASKIDTPSSEMDEDEMKKKRFKMNQQKRKSQTRTCTLVEETDANTKKIRLYYEYTKYFEAEGFNGSNKGFAVKTITNNDCGKALRALGISNGWNVTHCANKKLGNRMFAMLKNQISATAKMVGKTGYLVQFQQGAESIVSNQQNKSMPLSSPSLHNKPYSAPPKNIQNTSSNSQSQRQNNIGFKQTQLQQKPYAQKQALASPQRQQPQRKPQQMQQFVPPQRQQPQQKPQWQPPQKQAPQQRPQTQQKQKFNPPQRQSPQMPFGQKPNWQPPKKQALPFAPSQKQQTPDIHQTKSLPPKIVNKKAIVPLATATKVSVTNTRNTKKDASEEKSTAKRGKIQSVEVIQDEGDIKKLRLYHEFDRYIVSSAAKGPRGYKICGFNKFGDDIKSVGIDIGWKLVKIDDKDISRSFYQMVKNNVSVAFKKSNKKGYVVTLAAP